MSSRSQHWLIVIFSSLIIGSCSAFAERFLGAAINYFLPEAEEIASFRRPGSITILSTKNKIIQKIGPATREKVEFGKMPDLIRQAFIASEDRRFFKHKGIDIWGIFRAISSNLEQRKVAEGGSTITQQLARIVFLSQERSIIRKFKEAALAYKLEKQMSKELILLQYLNNVYLGSGAYGIADASWVYFSKAPKELSLEEAALIAGLAPAPSLYSPLVNLDLAIERRTVVLQRMFQEGFISKTQLNKALIRPLNLRPSLPKYINSKAPFFSSWVNKQLPQLLTPEQLEIGGLKIKTSLNLQWQLIAQKLIKLEAPENMEGAIVSIEPQTGLIRVLVGGKDFNSNQFNRATQALRSPGSTFKLFPFTAAIKEGFRVEDIFLDAPMCWKGYCPKNFGDKYMGKISLQVAFQESSNVVAVQLLEKVGYKEVISIANDLGVGNKNELGRYLPLAIGAYEVTVLEMTGAYAGITNRGKFIPPLALEEIRGPNNDLLWSHRKNSPKGEQVINRFAADSMNSLLRSVVRTGTGSLASLSSRQVAGKTGTSEGGRDLWFIGSIPQLTTGVWFGYDDNRKTKGSSGDAAWIWKKFMQEIEVNFPVIEFKNPR